MIPQEEGFNITQGMSLLLMKPLNMPANLVLKLIIFITDPKNKIGYYSWFFWSCISTFDILKHNSHSALVIKLFGKWFAAWEITGNPSYLGDHIKL